MVGGFMYLTYPQSMLSSDEIARNEEESGRILELLKNGGKIKYEDGVFKFES